jgi:hypothetical protein
MRGWFDSFLRGGLGSGMSGFRLSEMRGEVGVAIDITRRHKPSSSLGRELSCVLSLISP